MHKLIIDADARIGNAIAVVLAAISPTVDLIGLTVSTGLVQAAVGTSSYNGLLALVDPPKWPRLASSDASAPLPQLQPSSVLTSFEALYGETGFGEVRPPVVDLVHSRDASKLLIEMVKGAPGEVTILTLGPLTNLQLAAERDHDFLAAVKQIIVLGGTTDGTGELTAAAEINFLANPSAAKLVLSSRCPVKVLPRNLASTVRLSFRDFDTLPTPDSLTAKPLLQLLRAGLRGYHQKLGVEGLPLAEVAALLSVLQPGLFQSEPVYASVETDGQLTRGMLVIDRRTSGSPPPNIALIHRLEPAHIIEAFRSMLFAL